jgi:pSer/pThr/pTyr-binding forkhead associated (FHA) protein
MDAKLRVVSGLSSERTVRIARQLLIGRAEDCGLRLDGDFVSKHHCILLLDDYTLRLRDLGSKNGTFVNGHRVGASAIILLHDDTVSIGEASFLIDLTPEETVRADGEATVRDDGAEIIPPTLTKPAQPNISPPASDALGPRQRQEDGNG